MIDVKAIVKKLTTSFVYKVKVKQGYDDLTFEFNDIDEAAQFAQTCLERCVDTHGEFESTHVTITLDEVKLKLDNGNEKGKKPENEPVEEKQEEAKAENEPVEAEDKEEDAEQ